MYIYEATMAKLFVFFVPVWEPGVGPRETQFGKNLVDAAKAEGVKHFVWS